MTCRHCGADTPRLTVSQRYCPPCENRVRQLAAQDAARRIPRYPARDLSGLLR